MRICGCTARSEAWARPPLRSAGMTGGPCVAALSYTSVAVCVPGLDRHRRWRKRCRRDLRS
eukprot:828060-Rhodomonas_salina.1